MKVVGRVRSSIVAALAAGFVLGVAAEGRATPISVVNFSFETPVEGNGGFTTGGFSNGWIFATNSGVFDPNGQTTPTNGIQVGYSNGGLISQVLGTSLAAETLYTLTVDVMSRSDVFGIGTIALFAGSTQLATASSPSATTGTYSVTLNYNSLLGDPLAGQLLGIRLSRGSGSQADFDNVRLDGTSQGGIGVAAVPEPATMGLLGIGLLGLGVRKFRAARA